MHGFYSKNHRMLSFSQNYQMTIIGLNISPLRSTPSEGIHLDQCPAQAVLVVIMLQMARPLLLLTKPIQKPSTGINTVSARTHSSDAICVCD